MKPDRMHMPTGIPLKLAVSSFMGFLKGKSALMMRCLNADLKRKLGNRRFWVEGCVSNVGLNEVAIAKHIKEQEVRDIAPGKFSVKEYKDPFEKERPSGTPFGVTG